MFSFDNTIQFNSWINDFIINIKDFEDGSLSLIPSSLKLINFEPKRGRENLLKKFVVERCSNYDLTCFSTYFDGLIPKYSVKEVVKYDCEPNPTS